MTTFEGADRPNPHAILDRLSLINARRHVAMIAADPTLVSKAQTWLRDDARSMVVYRFWRFLLGRRPLELALNLLVEDSPRGRWVRGGNPFTLITPVETEASRRAMYRQAKLDVKMARGPLSAEFSAGEREAETLVDSAIRQAISRMRNGLPNDGTLHQAYPIEEEKKGLDFHPAPTPEQHGP